MHPLILGGVHLYRGFGLAPTQYNPNLRPIGHGFGFLVLMEEIEDW